VILTLELPRLQILQSRVHPFSHQQIAGRVLNVFRKSRQHASRRLASEHCAVCVVCRYQRVYWLEAICRSDFFSLPQYRRMTYTHKIKKRRTNKKYANRRPVSITAFSYFLPQALPLAAESVGRKKRWSDASLRSRPPGQPFQN